MGLFRKKPDRVPAAGPVSGSTLSPPVDLDVPLENP